MAKTKKNPVTEYDKREAFEKHCYPLLEELILLCRLHSIPCFFTACVKNDGDSSEYVTHSDEKEILGNPNYINDAVCTGSKGLELKDDQISKHLAVAAGFDVIPRRKELEMSFDAIDNPDDDELAYPGINENF